MAFTGINLGSWLNPEGYILGGRNVPFHHRHVRNDVAILKKALGWAAVHGIKVILDLHAPPAAQNFDWHSDSDGAARLWDDAQGRKATVDLWHRIAGECSQERRNRGHLWE